MWSTYYFKIPQDSMAEWIAHWPPDMKVVSSCPKALLIFFVWFFIKLAWNLKHCIPISVLEYEQDLTSSFWLTDKIMICIISIMYQIRTISIIVEYSNLNYDHQPWVTTKSMLSWRNSMDWIPIFTVEMLVQLWTNKDMLGNF